MIGLDDEQVRLAHGLDHRWSSFSGIGYYTDLPGATADKEATRRHGVM
jgi:hypothetical protein